MPTRWQSARELALSLPEAQEQPHFDKPSFRVRGRIFATLSESDARVTLKLAPADQLALNTLYGDAIRAVEGYWGQQGWTVVELDRIAAGPLQQLLLQSWRQVAPKRLIAMTEPADPHGGAVSPPKAAPGRRRRAAAGRQAADSKPTKS